MDLVLADLVAVEVLDRLDLVLLAVVLARVGLHHLLDARADVAHPHAHAHHLDASVGGRLHRRRELVVLGVPVLGPRAVADVAVHVHAEVHLDDVALLYHVLVAGVGGVVRRHVVQRDARGEAHAALEGVVAQSILVLAH